MRALKRSQSATLSTLTPRQQQVLHLLVAGRTNPEIAETLGVTLAGAKWHVSEVISRLGVTSREEAAEFWREQNRLPRRFSRAMRGLFGAGLLKTVAAGVAAVTLGGGVVVAGMVYAGSDSGPDRTKLAIVELAPTPIGSAQIPVDHAPRPFGGGSVVLDGIRQSDNATVVSAHLVGFPEADIPGLRIDLQLIGDDGTFMALNGRWNSPNGTRVWELPRTTGRVVLRLLGGATQPATAAVQLVVLDGSDNVALPGATASEVKDFNRRRVQLAARLEAMFAGSPPGEWSVILP